MTPRTCFVVMPYGTKEDVDGNRVDLDEVYEYLIKPAVEDVEGLTCIRSDDIDKPGWIHDRMLRHIATAPVAVVDTSTLNANVFYELGVRHALRRRVTVLIHRKGTTWPFNIAGMSSIEYDTSLTAASQARQRIATFIRNALADPDAVDSLVHNVLDDLQVHYGAVQAPRPVLETAVVEYPLGGAQRADDALGDTADRSIGVVTGDRRFLRVGDVWVNSENTNMQMDRYFGRSTSATIRYLGARKHPVTKRIVADTIADELAERLGDQREVDPATVVDTGAGELEETNGVRRIFHVASVIGEPREGYRPIARIERCVTEALAHADSEPLRGQGLRTIVFPLLGTGPGGGDVEDHAARLVDAAITYLRANASTIHKVYFYAWSDRERDALHRLLAADERLTAPAGAEGP